jgi:hypothetical protein
MDLGEYIELQGFTEEEPGELVVIKKMIGNYVKHALDRVPQFEKLVITHEANSRFTIHGKLLHAGKATEATHTDNNLFFALDGCLKRLHVAK